MGGELSIHLVEMSEFLFRISHILVFDLSLLLNKKLSSYPLSSSKNAPSRVPGVECKNMLVQV